MSQTLSSALHTKVDSERVKNFLCQDIAKIRSMQNAPFEDSYFVRYISSIVENTDSYLFVSLKTRLTRTSSPTIKDLNRLIKWERIGVKKKTHTHTHTHTK